MSQRPLVAEWIAFLIVGAAGFIIDAAITYFAIHGFGIGEYLARLPAFAVAVTCVWFLNRRFTFAIQGASNRFKEWTRFVAVYSVGTLINFSVYALVLHLMPRHVIMPLLGIAAGQVVAMVWNFIGARSYAFRRGALNSASMRSTHREV